MLFLLFFFFTIGASYANYYDTLPAGVRNFTFRLIHTGSITGSYGNSGNFKGYNINTTINADSIKGVSNAVDTYLNSLSATDYANFSFGTFEGSATSKVTAEAFGFGYGITNQITVYGFIPFYSAQVDLKIARTKKGRNNVGTAIQLENLPDVDVRLIQSLFVNYYHYQPLGKWKANDFGDAEIGFMTQLKKWKNAGALINVGFVAPTGRQDNPDILQDISFGDGQWDAFYEWGGGINLNSAWSLNNWTRLTYQFPYETMVRTLSSNTFLISANKTMARIKLGNKAQTNVEGNFQISDLWSTSLLYTLEYVEPSQYRSVDQLSDRILAEDSEKISHIARLSLGYSTLKLYQQKKFFMPINLTMSFQTIFAGKNIPKYERADFDVKLFF